MTSTSAGSTLAQTARLLRRLHPVSRTRTIQTCCTSWALLSIIWVRVDSAGIYSRLNRTNRRNHRKPNRHHIQTSVSGILALFIYILRTTNLTACRRDMVICGSLFNYHISYNNRYNKVKIGQCANKCSTFPTCRFVFSSQCTRAQKPSSQR